MVNFPGLHVPQTLQPSILFGSCQGKSVHKEVLRHLGTQRGYWKNNFPAMLRSIWRKVELKLQTFRAVNEEHEVGMI